MCFIILLARSCGILRFCSWLGLAVSKSSSVLNDEIISYKHGNLLVSVSTNCVLCAPDFDSSGQHLDKARCFIRTSGIADVDHQYDHVALAYQILRTVSWRQLQARDIDSKLLRQAAFAQDRTDPRLYP